MINRTTELITSELFRAAAIVVAFIALAGFMNGCNQRDVSMVLAGTETPEQIGTKMEDVGAAHATLWDALQADQELFSEAEWTAASSLHNRALDLSAEMIVGMSAGVLPPVGDVEVWKVTGEMINKDASALLEPKLPDLSGETRVAWAIQKARLRALGRSANGYIANPNAAMYASFAKIGLSLGAKVLTGGVL